MKFEDDTINVDGLDRLMKALKAPPPRAKLGVLGRNSARTGAGASTETNASILLKHEFGDLAHGLPQRSVLRQPLTDNLNKELEKSKLFTDDVFNKVLKEKSLYQWVLKVAIVGKAVVLGAFATGGYGKWKPTVIPNKTGMTLVDTTQLRDSIDYDVKEQ